MSLRQVGAAELQPVPGHHPQHLLHVPGAHAVDNATIAAAGGARGGEAGQQAEVPQCDRDRQPSPGLRPVLQCPVLGAGQRETPETYQ